MTLSVRLNQLVLDDPVEFSVEFERIVLEVAEGVFPHIECELFLIGEVVVLGEAKRPVEIFALDVEGGDLAPFASRTRRVQVMSWLISRIARIGFSRVMSRSTTWGSSSMRNMSEHAPTLRKVVYSLMLESPTIT